MAVRRKEFHTGSMVRTPLASLLLLALLLGPLPALAQSHDMARRLPDWEVFAQTGWAESDVSSYAIGAQHALPWRGQLLGTYWHSYSEITVARWIADEPGPADSNHFTQFGISPVVRIQYPSLMPGFFVDLGVGAYLITPIYRHNGKRFGSAYNFGDQIGFGWQLGRSRRQEVSLRIQHFSNGGIKQPNPGENFLQARFLIRLSG
jgi:lipid A 3-O-deacylase